MYIPKRYGQSKTDQCPFCNKQAVTQNSQGIPVCSQHKSNDMTGIRCSCGETLDVRSGKFGAYFNCINCGNINFRKGLELNKDMNQQNYKINKLAIKNVALKPSIPDIQESKDSNPRKEYYKKDYSKSTFKPREKFKERKEITITSDDIDLYYS